MGKKKKKASSLPYNKHQFNMKLVTSDKCETCRQCDRGIAYLERMSQPGAVGYGVPCILTKGKSYN